MRVDGSKLRRGHFIVNDGISDCIMIKIIKRIKTGHG